MFKSWQVGQDEKLERLDKHIFLRDLQMGSAQRSHIVRQLSNFKNPKPVSDLRAKGRDS